MSVATPLLVGLLVSFILGNYVFVYYEFFGLKTKLRGSLLQTLFLIVHTASFVSINNFSYPALVVFTISIVFVLRILRNLEIKDLHNPKIRTPGNYLKAYSYYMKYMLLIFSFSTIFVTILYLLAF